jgi:hypothetical protein
MNELSKRVSFNLFPNPSTGETTVKFRLDDASNISVQVVDVVGKQVLPNVQAEYNAGEHSISVNKNKTLRSGIYFVNLNVNGSKLTKKLIIE